MFTMILLFFAYLDPKLGKALNIKNLRNIRYIVLIVISVDMLDILTEKDN